MQTAARRIQSKQNDNLLHIAKAVKLKKMVGPTGFEPATSPTPRVRATKLRYGPKKIQNAYQA